jgi:hypothetical protein
VISLRKNPGATVFTRIECRAHCTASSAVRPDSPALAAAYDACGIPGTPTRPLIDDTWTIAPRPLATMWGNTAWLSRKGATRLSARARAIRSAGSSSALTPPSMPPATFTRISGPVPRASTTRGTTPSTWSSSRRSAGTAAPSTSLARSSRRSTRRAASATRAPAPASVRATAAPSPDDAPVTNATRPVRSNMSSFTAAVPPCSRRGRRSPSR